MDITKAASQAMCTEFCEAADGLPLLLVHS